MARPDAIRVRGLAEFRRALKDLDAGLPRMLRQSLNEAGEVITEHTAPWVPKRTGRARASLKLRSTQSSARVTHGGNRAPYVPWLDFGGRVGRGRTGPGTGSVIRPRVPSGRYVWRTMGKRSDDVTEVLDRALVDLAERSGLAVRDGA